MRKKISLILYTLFFGFSLTLVVSCVLLMVECFNNRNNSEGLEAVSIEPVNDVDTSYQDIGNRLSMVSNSLTGLNCDYAYNTLTDENERYLYHKLNKNLYCIEESTNSDGCYRTEYVVVSGTEMPENSVKRVLDAFLTDHPEIFWINNTFGYAYDKGNTVVECYSLLSAQQCGQYIERLSQRISELLDGVGEIGDDYSKEKLLHDRLLSQCSYADGVSDISDGWQYFTAYGAIVDGSAVCEGYSKAFQILLEKVGISGYTVKGYADDVRHMWNIVELGEKWYHVDTTWNDGEDGINYEFFNLDTHQIEKSHIIDPIAGEEIEQNENFFLPECDSMEMNYYNMDGINVDRFDDETDRRMVEYIVECVNSGSNYLYVTVGSDFDFEDCTSTLFDAPSYRIHHYIEIANSYLDSGHKINREGIKMLKDEERRTIRINLKIGE